MNKKVNLKSTVVACSLFVVFFLLLKSCSSNSEKFEEPILNASEASVAYDGTSMTEDQWAKHRDDIVQERLDYQAQLLKEGLEVYIEPLTFKQAFAEARMASMGPNGTFVWNDMTYTTAYWEEVYGLSENSVVDSTEPSLIDSLDIVPFLREDNDSTADEVGVESGTVNVEHSVVDETASE